MSSAAGAAAAQQAAMINAIRSFGVITTMEPDDFLALVGKQDEPLVVTAIGGFFTTEYRYMMNYKGLVFFTRTPYPITLPAGTEVVRAQKMLMPGNV